MKRDERTLVKGTVEHGFPSNIKDLRWSTSTHADAVHRSAIRSTLRDQRTDIGPTLS